MAIDMQKQMWKDRTGTSDFYTSLRHRGSSLRNYYSLAASIKMKKERIQNKEWKSLHDSESFRNRNIKIEKVLINSWIVSILEYSTYFADKCKLSSNYCGDIWISRLQPWHTYSGKNLKHFFGLLISAYSLILKDNQFL